MKLNVKKIIPEKIIEDNVNFEMMSENSSAEKKVDSSSSLNNKFTKSNKRD